MVLAEALVALPAQRVASVHAAHPEAGAETPTAIVKLGARNSLVHAQAAAAVTSRRMAPVEALRVIIALGRLSVDAALEVVTAAVQ